MARRTKKGLSQADIDAWRLVAKTVSPLDPSPPGSVYPPIEKLTGADPSSPPIPRPKKVSSTLAPNLKPVPPRPEPPRLDGKTHDKLRKGKLRPERRVDLHGMSAARAQSALTHFILSAWADGCRVVLVITGKGSADPMDDGIIPRRRGVIRQSLPQWLAMPPLNDKVLQSSVARDRDGGGGAFYVYLKRKRGVSPPD